MSYYLARPGQKMEIPKPTTLEDFPKFVVTAVRRGAASESGYTWFELEGAYDRILESRFDPKLGMEAHTSGA